MKNLFKRKQEDAQSIILDTCGLIDGRILDIARAGFLPRQVLIPQFIIAELQFLADHGDSHKRERARYGLDMVRTLQDLRRTEVTISREQFPGIREVDDKLVALAKQLGAKLYTTDYNLNKVAQIEGVDVLNVNELAQALRPRRLPGERIELKITQVGQDRSQGVGYLDDGTMVVVEKAGNKIGQRIIVEFSRMLQTQAGKMMFAVLPGGHQKPVGKKQLPSQHNVSVPEQKPALKSQNNKEQSEQPTEQPHAKAKPSQRPERQPQTTQRNRTQPKQPAQAERQVRQNRPQAGKPQNVSQSKPQSAGGQRPKRKVSNLEESLLEAINKSQE